MTIIYVSDFDLAGSGYMNIGVSLCNQLADAGYDVVAPSVGPLISGSPPPATDYGVVALGLGYKGQEHRHPFKIVPTTIREIVPMVNIISQSTQVEALVVALDIPLQEAILHQLDAPSGLPYIGLFPLESDPLCMSWATSLLRMDKRLIMSRCGQAELEAAGVESDFIPIGIDPDSWRPPTIEEREKLRQGLGVEEGTTVVLTVADNQERKNLSRTMEIFASFSGGHRAVYWMVTRPKSQVGWHLEDYAMGLGIFDRLTIWERGISFKQLWSLYAAADIFLLTSKAEGLAMPVLEAMSCRLPVVGTNCAAIREHLSDGRGLLIESDYIMADPWGNANRYMADCNNGVYNLRLWAAGMTPIDKVKMLDSAQAYAKERSITGDGAVLIEAIESLRNGRE